MVVVPLVDEDAMVVVGFWVEWLRVRGGRRSSVLSLQCEVCGVESWEREKSGKRRFVCPAPTHVVPSFFFTTLPLGKLDKLNFIRSALGHVNRCLNRYIMLAMSVCTYWQLSYHHFLCTGSPSPGVDTPCSFYLLYRYPLCIFWYLEAWLEVLLYIKLALAILYSFILWLWPIC